MTDAAIADAPVELEQPVPSAPEAIGGQTPLVGSLVGAAEIEAALPQAAAVDGLAPATEQAANLPVDRSASVDAVAAPSAEAPAERALPFDVEHLGVLRRAVLDALVDADEPLTVSRIVAEMPPGTTRGNVESAIKRNFDAGLIERVGAGLYVLGKPKPPKPAEPTRPSPVAPEDEQVWLAAFEAWVVSPDSWDREKLGPRPNEPGRRIPADIVAKGVDRSRKRQERRREAEAAAAKRAAADAELRDRLIAATGGNVIRTSALDDVSPIKLALEVVPLERVLSAIRSKTDRKLFPGNAPARSWGEERLLREIAESYTRTDIVPNLIAAWAAAGRAPATKAQSLPAAVAPMPVGDIDRGYHDDPSAAPGPHIVVPPGAVDAAPPEATGASEASSATLAGPEQENAPEGAPVQPAAILVDRPAISAEPAAVDAKPPAEPTRASVLAAFARTRAQASPQPVAPQARPAVRQAERPPERQAEPISREGWEELVSGFVAGNVIWNTRRLGAPPGSPDCRAPRDVLRSFGL